MLGHHKSASTVAVMTLERVLCSSTREIQAGEGHIDADYISDFIEFQLLPYMNPFPGPRNILVMDNAVPHQKTRIMNLLATRGTITIFLPPYSYDFNPIEKVFKMTRSAMRRYHSHLQRIILVRGNNFCWFLSPFK